jgi:hypothetical protein
MHKCLIIFACITIQLHALTLNRAILATDAHPDYIEFWPTVARAWKEIVGITPTLLLVAPDDVQVDTSLGDVIRFEPIEGIPTAFQAQVIRLLAPALFPEDVCILSDIDMIPLNRSYFLDSITDCPDTSFVVYRNHGYAHNASWYPICYVAARGSTYGEIFHISTIDDIRSKLKELYDLQLGWHTDEITLAHYLKEWPDVETRCIMLGHGVERRFDRSIWLVNLEYLINGHYIDAHCPRPYHAYQDCIETLLAITYAKIAGKTLKLVLENPDPATYSSQLLTAYVEKTERISDTEELAHYHILSCNILKE